MKKKSLSVKTKKHKSILKYLNHKDIQNVFYEFKKSINKKNTYAAAISGGPDSLALAYLTKCISILYKIKIKYYHVDHKLRKDSTLEAKKVLKILKKKLNINCKILTWKGNKPQSNIQSNAREKRYNLLGNECKKTNTIYLLTGHNLDDLYENFLLRILRGSGLKGLVSLDKISNDNFNSLKIIRPLIYVKKAELKNISKKVFNFFIDDPSNLDEKFKRIRIRNLIKTLEFEGLDKNKLKLTIKNLKDSNSTVDYFAKQNLDQNSVFFENKRKFFLNKNFFNQPNEVIFRSMGNVLKKVSRRYYLPRGKSINNAILQIKDQNFKKTTLGGCIIEKASETIIVFQERS